MVGGIDARRAVLAEAPVGQSAEDRERFPGRYGSAVRGEDIGPDNGVAIEDGTAVGAALVDVRLGLGVEVGEPGLSQVVSK
jgi:hypothetical protein